MQIQDSAKTPKAVFTISDVLNDSTKKAKLLGIIEEIVICKEIIRQQNDAIKDIQECSDGQNRNDDGRCFYGAGSSF